MYFKPPGELGRDVHQNIFYSHTDWGEIINISLALNDADRENGCLYYYPGSHKEKICYPIPDELKDEERMKTNPSDWENERGKPIFVPGTYFGGEWVDKYPKVYIPVKEGSVTFLQSHVLHGSDDNVSKDRWRGAFLVGYEKKGGNFFAGSHMERELIDVYN
jgi:ectoine hydroxylase-related dioxygenase (phytanoyl-CoA dioxygenase family)